MQKGQKDLFSGPLICEWTESHDHKTGNIAEDKECFKSCGHTISNHHTWAELLSAIPGRSRRHSALKNVINCLVLLRVCVRGKPQRRSQMQSSLGMKILHVVEPQNYNREEPEQMLETPKAVLSSLVRTTQNPRHPSEMRISEPVTDGTVPDWTQWIISSVK